MSADLVGQQTTKAPSAPQLSCFRCFSSASTCASSEAQGTTSRSHQALTCSDEPRLLEHTRDCQQCSVAVWSILLQARDDRLSDQVLQNPSNPSSRPLPCLAHCVRHCHAHRSPWKSLCPLRAQSCPQFEVAAASARARRARSCSDRQTCTRPASTCTERRTPAHAGWHVLRKDSSSTHTCSDAPYLLHIRVLASSALPLKPPRPSGSQSLD